MIQDLFGGSNGAIFSEDKKYRYVLWRIWDKNKPLIMFIGLNPSTANEYIDDPTIRRIKTFTKIWEYGGFYMLNLFTYITVYPEELIKCNNPLKLANWYLEIYVKKCEKIVFAWGSFQEAKNRAEEIINRLKGYALKINKDGMPAHPLYIPTNTKLIKFN